MCRFYRFMQHHVRHVENSQTAVAPHRKILSKILSYNRSIVHFMLTVAQLVEHQIVILTVASSSLVCQPNEYPSRSLAGPFPSFWKARSYACIRLREIKRKKQNGSHLFCGIGNGLTSRHQFCSQANNLLN